MQGNPPLMTRILLLYLVTCTPIRGGGGGGGKCTKYRNKMRQVKGDSLAPDRGDPLSLLYTITYFY